MKDELTRVRKEGEERLRQSSEDMRQRHREELQNTRQVLFFCGSNGLLCVEREQAHRFSVPLFHRSAPLKIFFSTRETALKEQEARLKAEAYRELELQRQELENRYAHILDTKMSEQRNTLLAQAAQEKVRYPIRQKEPRVNPSAKLRIYLHLKSRRRWTLFNNSRESSMRRRRTTWSASARI